MLAQSKLPSAKPTPLRKPPPLDFAQLIAQRRASRVAQNTQMEANTNHFWKMKNSIELENAYQEKQRMSSYLRLGTVPAHIAHPIAAAMARGVSAMDVDVSAMDVDEEVVVNGLVQEIAQRSAASKHTQSVTRDTAGARGVPHMAKFTSDEKAVGRSGDTGVANRLLYPAAIISRNVKMRARNAETRKAFANTDNKRANAIG